MEYLKKIKNVTDPEHTKVSDIMKIEVKKEKSTGISPDTRVKEMAKKYPWMGSKLPEIFPEAKKHLNNPLTRRVLLGMKLGAVAEQMGMTFDELMDKIEPLIASNS